MMMDGARARNGAAFNTKAIGSGDDSTVVVHVVTASNMRARRLNTAGSRPAITIRKGVICNPTRRTGAMWMKPFLRSLVRRALVAIFNEDHLPMHAGTPNNVSCHGRRNA